MKFRKRQIKVYGALKFMKLFISAKTAELSKRKLFLEGNSNFIMKNFPVNKFQSQIYNNKWRKK